MLHVIVVNIGQADMHHVDSQGECACTRQSAEKQEVHMVSTWTV